MLFREGGMDYCFRRRSVLSELHEATAARTAEVRLNEGERSHGYCSRVKATATRARGMLRLDKEC